MSPSARMALNSRYCSSTLFGAVASGAIVVGALLAFGSSVVVVVDDGAEANGVVGSCLGA
jgi:hypothetical protein